ncbi:MAG: hypothetical protein Q8R28_11395 [Dehalococcoidia bacterium]|nr:hypothetical protein [Dehalococcoidia bacterium]MDZ4231860.1 hypothetical protein [Candidatus Pacearchaeota archaeon]
MRLNIFIDTDNAAFMDQDDPGTEAARILRALADRLQGNHWISPGYSQALHDINGNEVGNAWVTADHRERPTL